MASTSGARVKSPLDKIEESIEGMSSDIKKASEQIEKVDKRIEEVDKRIEEVGQRISECTTADEITHLRKEKILLMEEKKSMIEEKKSIREEKALQLRERSSMRDRIPNSTLTARSSKRSRTVETQFLGEAAKYNAEEDWFELPGVFLKNRYGVSTLESGLLYCRPQFHELFKFLTGVMQEKRSNAKEGHNPYTFGWILGPPGSGKSTTAVAFVSTIDREKWVITWIQLARHVKPTFDQYVRGIKRTGEVEVENIDEVLEVALENTECHILFVDGYVQQRHQWLGEECGTWVKANFEKRRLVIICSMSVRGKRNAADDLEMGCKDFSVESWTLNDYRRAVKNEVFFSSVSTNLDSVIKLHSADGTPSRDELLESKFHFAGGSCRYMFGLPTEAVADDIMFAVEATEDIWALVEGNVGDRAPGAVNRLRSSLPRYKNTKESSIISLFAGTQLSIKLGPNLISRYRDVLKPNLNPSMGGWLFEMWFFASLAYSGVKLKCNGKTEMWERAVIDTVDVNKIAGVPDAPTWWKPLRWNQGGYDAIFVDKGAGLVRFVQVTAAVQHDLKIECFYSFMLAAGAFMSTNKLDIYFLSPKGTKPKISGVSGLGLLAKLKFKGWEKGKETSAVKRCTVDWSPR